MPAPCRLAMGRLAHTSRPCCTWAHCMWRPPQTGLFNWIGDREWTCPGAYGGAPSVACGCMPSVDVPHAVPVACCSPTPCVTLCADVPKPEMPKVGGTLHAAVEAAVPSEILPLQPMLAQEFTMNIIRLIPCPFINQCARQAGHGLWELNPGATCGGVMLLCCACTASLAACHLCVGPLVAGVAACRAGLLQQQQESLSHKSTGPCVW